MAPAGGSCVGRWLLPFNPQFAIRNPQLIDAVAFGSPLNGLVGNGYTYSQSLSH